MSLKALTDEELLDEIHSMEQALRQYNEEVERRVLENARRLRPPEALTFTCGLRISCPLCWCSICANASHDEYCGDETDPHAAMAIHKMNVHPTVSEPVTEQPNRSQEES